MRNAGWIAALALLFLSGGVGLYDGVGDLREAAGALQRSVSIAVLLYGVLGLAAGTGLARRRAWAVPLCVAWAAAVVYAASIASFAFHDPTFAQDSTATGVIASAISTTLMGALVVWAARVATRAPRVPRSAETGHIPTP